MHKVRNLTFSVSRLNKMKFWERLRYLFARFIGHFPACYSTKIKNKNQKMKLFVTS